MHFHFIFCICVVKRLGTSGLCSKKTQRFKLVLYGQRKRAVVSSFAQKLENDQNALHRTGQISTPICFETRKQQDGQVVACSCLKPWSIFGQHCLEYFHRPFSRDRNNTASPQTFTVATKHYTEIRF